jgi:hypothetical protein
MRGVLAAMTACLVLSGPADAAASARLHAFGSCSNLLGYAKHNGLRVIRDTRFVGPVPPPVSRDGGGGTGKPVAAPVPAAGEDSSSQTNVQEAGVDEPDWVKLSGTTLFAATGGRLVAFDAGGDRARVLGSVAVGGWAPQLFVKGDRVLVIESSGFGDVVAAQVPGVAPARWIGRTRLSEVDVSDPRAMRVLRTLDVEGSFVSGRLTGSTARVVIQADARGIELPSADPTRAGWMRAVRRTRTRAWLPSSVLRDRRTGRVKRRAVVRCRQVRRPQRFSGLGTLTVLTIDMARGLPAVDADSLMASGETVYASADRLYVASERWLGEDPARSEIRDLASTSLHAFSTTRAGTTRYVGSGAVDGYLLNQWALSEKDGVLRAATTSMPGGASSSSLRTLEERDGALREIGSVGGLGQGERIYAVRYVGDTAFVVTFRQVDPLYTVDLSDPRAPRVVGSLKVPGYSAYLHPLGDGLLLGVGQDADAAGRTQGVKLSVFDVSDLRSPRQLSSASVGEGSYTDAEYDHHAFLWWGPERLAVLPVQRYAAPAFSGMLAYRVSRAGKLSEAARMPSPGLANEGGASFSRAVVAGSRLLLISDTDVLTTFVNAPGPGEITPFPR